MNDVREALNRIRNFAQILRDHSQALTQVEVARTAQAIEHQSETALHFLDGSAEEAPAASEAAVAYRLSERELEVLRLVSLGMADKQIAERLGISTFTVSKHVGAILQKMAALSRTEAGVRAVRESLV